eukprot:CCRYP_008089-RA/>CCRYP_008089-RA protein AED:0.15 eAED:0.15 QI:0/-1/0/1/-1/1/1/0/454
MASYQVSSRRRWFSPVWRTSVLFNKCIFVSGNAHLTRLAKEEISKKNTKACFPPHHKLLFGKHSILVTSGEEHDKVRKLISPALQPHLYKKEIDMAAADLVEDCLKHCAKHSDSFESRCVSLVPKFKQFSLRVTLRIVLGDERWQEWNADTKGNRLLTLLEDFAIWSKGLLSAPTASIPFTPAHRAMLARGRIKRVLLEIIQEEREAVQLGKSHSTSTSGNTLDSNGSLIRMLLHKGEKENSFISDDAIIDNVLTILFAGTDTTASILTSSFFELAKNQSLRERLQSCVNDPLTDGKGDAHSADDILLAFISEVQRMYPSAPFTMREVVKQSIDMGDGLGTIPPGHYVTYSIAGTLLDDETSYSNPQEFNLDRFLIKGDSKAKPPIWAFGGGNRTCPGRFLANAESIALLRLVLSKERGFGWELQDDQKVEFSYEPGFFPSDGLRVKLFRNDVF